MFACKICLKFGTELCILKRIRFKAKCCAPFTRTILPRFMRILNYLTLLLIPYLSYGQVTITGQVFSKEEGIPIPGVNVIEKGTTNGTAADLTGRFSIKVNDLPTTLVFTWIGAITKEITVDSQKDLVIELKYDCTRHTYDHQLIGFYLNSGVINNPFGGEFHLTFPAFWRMTTLKGKVGYQTDFDLNQNINGQIAFDHILFTCDYDLDFKADYQRTIFKDNIEFEIKSIEIHFNLDKNSSKINYARFIVGLSRIEFESNEDLNTINDVAPIFGVGTRIGEWWRLLVVGKVTFYKNFIKYDVELSRDFRRIDTFIRFQGIESYNELSLGIGTNIGYRLKKQQM